MSDRPNILFITSDQHRGAALGCAGHPCISTPHLDQLAYEGLRFDNAYTDCPVCIPARTTMITGIQAHVFGAPRWDTEYRIERDDARFLGSLMTRAGYQTELIGKTHWFTEGSYRAGFEHVLSYRAMARQRARELGRPTREINGLGFNELYPHRSHIPLHLYSTDWAVDRALEFLEDRDRSKPFFLWLSVIDPHPPFSIHEPYYSMYDGAAIPEPVIPDWLDTDACPSTLHNHRWAFNPGPMSPREVRKARGVYYGMITNLDHQLGRLFGRLMVQGLWDDTLVVYTTDHGEQLGDYHDAHKYSFFEGPARLPMIWRFPRRYGFAPGRVSPALVELADLLPTFCEVAGVAAPDDVTGHSLMPLVSGDAEAVRATLHGQIDAQHMFHTGRYKYLYFGDDGSELLFDMHASRRDAANLAGDVARVAPIRQRFIEHLREEGNAHLVDGELLNRHQGKEPVAVLRARNPLGWGGAGR